MGPSFYGEAQKIDRTKIKAWALRTALLSEALKKKIVTMPQNYPFLITVANRTLIICGKKCHSGALFRKRLAILFCSNMIGTDGMKSLGIGKFTF